MNWGNTERPRELMPRTVSEPSPPPSQAEAPSTTPGGGDHFGCPFAKRYDPDCDNRHPCAKRAFQTVHRLKEHLFRSHNPPFTCPRCHYAFKQKKDLETHLISDVICTVRPAPNKDEINSLTDAQVEEVKKKRKAAVSEETEWKRIYMLLFPNHADIPLPYVRSKQLELPPYVKDDLTTEIRNLITRKIRTDPRYRDFHPTLLEGVVDNDLMDEAFERVQVITRGSKRRRSSTSREGDRTIRRAPRTRISSIYGPPEVHERLSSSKFPPVIPETLRQRSLDLNNPASAGSQPDHVREVEYREVESSDSPPIAPRQHAQNSGISSSTEFQLHSSPNGRQQTQDNALHPPIPGTSPQRRNQVLNNTLSTEFQPEPLSPFQPSSWMSELQQSYEGTLSWSFDSPSALNFDSLDPAASIHPNLVTRPTAGTAEGWVVLPQPLDSSPSPTSCTGRRQE